MNYGDKDKDLYNLEKTYCPHCGAEIELRFSTYYNRMFEYCDRCGYDEEGDWE